MRWQDKLTKQELGHVKEFADTLRQFREMRVRQIKFDVTKYGKCSICETIAKKLGLK